MTLHRLAELRKEIKAQPIEAADQQEFQEAHHVVEADRDVADGVEAEETAVFRDNVKVGDQVAILVDRDEEGVPFLIGDVRARTRAAENPVVLSCSQEERGDGQVDS